jgi:hypothetical protein
MTWMGFGVIYTFQSLNTRALPRVQPKAVSIINLDVFTQFFSPIVLCSHLSRMVAKFTLEPAFNFSSILLCPLYNIYLRKNSCAATSVVLDYKLGDFR